MGSIQFSGLQSGLDTSSIVEQLVAVEKLPANKLREQKSDVQSQAKLVTELISQLNGLKDEAANFDTAKKVASYTGSSTDETTVTVSTEGNALPGTFDISVTRLARGETSASTTFADANGPGVDGSLTITVGTDPSVQIDYLAADSLYEIASKINNDDTIKASSAVVDDGQGGFRLLITSDNTGAGSAITFSETGGPLSMSELVAAQDSRIVMNTLTIDRPTNTMSDVLSGVTLNLLKETGAGPNTIIKVERDREALKKKIDGFVDEFNDVMNFINGQLGYVEGADTSATLFGDSTLQGIQRRVNEVITNPYTHDSGSTQLGLLGIELSNTGVLAVDTTKFNTAADSDPTAFEHLFAGDGADGLVKVLTDMIVGYTQSPEGILSKKKTGLDDRVSGYDEQIERIELRATELGERLNRQFTALEQTVLRLNSQQGFLASMI